jgi:hypothetical protein
MHLYRDESSYAKINAQRNLSGRTHYVDDSTLRFHKSKVLRARVHDNGLLFSVVTSDALDMNGTKRGFRYAIFDIFGNVIARPELADAFKTSEQASKAMYAVLNGIDAFAHTREAIESARAGFEMEMADVARTVAVLESKAKESGK